MYYAMVKSAEGNWHEEEFEGFNSIEEVIEYCKERGMKVKKIRYEE